MNSTIFEETVGIEKRSDWRKKEFSKPNGLIHIGTSFSGIGAVEHALDRMGIKHEILFAGDIDDKCKKAYFANYNISETQWHTDVHDFNAKPFKDKIDLFVGGAPCQAFSLRGKHGGFEDTRGTLFREFARIVMECRPKIFIFENVKGMLSHDKGNTWKVIKETFEKDCGYDVHFKVLNGKDYGIPQSRERLFCIGFKEKTDFSFPAPIHLKKTIYDFLEQSIDKKYFLKHKGVNFITRRINHQKSYTQINGDIMLCQKRNQQFNWHGDFVFHPLAAKDNNETVVDDLIFKVSDYEESYYIKYHPERYALKRYEDGQYGLYKETLENIDLNYGRYRKMTPRECLRLMGFDDSFKIVVNDTESYKQSGNSIIVDVLIAILKELDITKYAE
jgi:DNA (cytosine-5)-methyltransferase 1